MQFRELPQRDELSDHGRDFRAAWAEVPIDVYGECLIRTATINGILMQTFTPLAGLTETVLQFLPDMWSGDAYPPLRIKVIENTEVGFRPSPDLRAVRSNGRLEAIIPIAALQYFCTMGACLSFLLSVG